jgi:hypothetical protein
MGTAAKACGAKNKAPKRQSPRNMYLEKPAIYKSSAE